MTGLVLEGGGAKGAYQAGAYFALKKCHVKINAVVGTSIGSFNAALIASHEEEKMKNLWKDTSIESILGLDEEMASQILNKKITKENMEWSFKTIYNIFKDGGLDISNYKALVRNNVNEEKLRRSKINFGLTTLKRDGLKPVELFTENIPSGLVHEYIVASSYLPIFKKQKLIDDSYYLDGGFYNLSPVNMLERIGCDKIYIVNIKGVGFRQPKKKNRAQIIEIKPSSDLGSIVLFDKESNEENMKRGYLDTLKVLKKLDGFEYTFKKRPYRQYKHFVEYIDNKLYNATEVLVSKEGIKNVVIGAVEHALKKANQKDLTVYDIKKAILYINSLNNRGIIYDFIRNLNI